jgi:chromosome segregation ATPase
MTRDELRGCLNDQDRLQQLVAKIKSEQAELERQRAEIERIDAELGGSVGTVDPNYRASLEALKKERAKRDAMADAYNARLAGARELNASYESGRTSWTDRCANRGYDPKDEAAIRLEQKQAAEAGTKKD